MEKFLCIRVVRVGGRESAKFMGTLECPEVALMASADGVPPFLPPLLSLLPRISQLLPPRDRLTSSSILDISRRVSSLVSLPAASLSFWKLQLTSTLVTLSPGSVGKVGMGGRLLGRPGMLDDAHTDEECRDLKSSSLLALSASSLAALLRPLNSMELG